MSRIDFMKCFSLQMTLIVKMNLRLVEERNKRNRSSVAFENQPANEYVCLSNTRVSENNINQVDHCRQYDY